MVGGEVRILILVDLPLRMKLTLAFDIVGKYGLSYLYKNKLVIEYPDYS